jgi:hypothetical protein
VSLRVREDSVHPRLQSGASVRALNFPVRGHLGRRMRTVIRLLFFWVVASLVAAAVLLLYAIPWHPHSARGWTIFLLVALPISLAGDYIGERIFSNPFARRLDASGSGVKASVNRIGYVVLCFLGVAVAAIWAFGMLNKTGWLGAL